jgi:8-oxo-dGTP diphosphatase
MSESLPRVGSALIVRDEASRILLGRRNKDPHRGSWILPGGKIHAFETIAEAAARELAEETGLEVLVERQFRVYEVINAPKEHRIVIYSWAKAIGGALRASDDVSEVRFVSLEELGDLPLTPLVRQVLADAGYLHQKLSCHVEPASSLSPGLFPIAIAGAICKRSKRHSTRRTGDRRKSGPIYRQGSLRFEPSDAD